MFERFTERARQVVVLAQDEARSLGHSYIGTEHILLGLVREDQGLAARVLAELGVGIDDVRARVVAEVGEGQDHVRTGQIPFTPRAKKVLELALREAMTLGHDYIGTEHLLLAMGRENGGVGMHVLWDLGVGDANLRAAVLGTLNGEPFAPEIHERRGREPARRSRRAMSGRSRIATFGGLLLAAGLAVGILLGWAIWG